MDYMSSMIYKMLWIFKYDFGWDWSKPYFIPLRMKEEMNKNTNEKNIENNENARQKKANVSGKWKKAKKNQRSRDVLGKTGNIDPASEGGEGVRGWNIHGGSLVTRNIG